MKTFAFAALLVLGVTSCNTMIGVGRDFRQLGQGMEHVAHGRHFNGTEKAPEDEVLPTY